VPRPCEARMSGPKHQPQRIKRSSAYYIPIDSMIAATFGPSAGIVDIAAAPLYSRPDLGIIRAGRVDLRIHDGRTRGLIETPWLAFANAAFIGPHARTLGMPRVFLRRATTWPMRTSPAPAMAHG